MINKAIGVFAGNLIFAALAFARSVLVARLIGVEEFGIASTLSLVLVFVYMTSDVGVNTLVVQSRDGSDKGFMGTAHLVQMLRGAMTAIITIAAAIPLARLFGAPQAAWAFACLAAVPLVRGFAHLDMYRAQRELRNGPSMLVLNASIAASVLSIVPLSYMVHDFSLMLYAILIEQAVFTIVSHLVARDRFSLAFDRAVFRRLWSFGVPSFLNNAALFASFHGDRAIVASVLGLRDFGLFSAAMTMTNSLGLIVARNMMPIFLPLLSRERDRPDGFQRVARMTKAVTFALSCGFAAGTAIVGPVVLHALYGPSYQAAGIVLIMLGAVQGMRLLRIGSAVIAAAKADAASPLQANLLRAAAMLLALVFALAGYGLTAVLAAALLGEIIASGYAEWVDRTKYGVTLPFGLRPVLLAGMICALPFVCTAWGLFGTGSVWPRLGFGGAILALLGLLGWLLPDLRLYLMMKIKDLRK
jgi:O-antigen/teichoic acid export membrane protein